MYKKTIKPFYDEHKEISSQTKFPVLMLQCNEKQNYRGSNSMINSVLEVNGQNWK